MTCEGWTKDDGEVFHLWILLGQGIKADVCIKDLHNGEYKREGNNSSVGLMLRCFAFEIQDHELFHEKSVNQQSLKRKRRRQKIG